ncbi:unnamed protein product [Miscanthus lutarioriparius]|uniref:SET domain-containing protein n=1 Tax=Miscanthus lutarioriparius TaxID=422564 RepID=A0A811MDV3_9POAL|nr:unnamed protein product [Miscanthus lutarioriparius]
MARTRDAGSEWPLSGRRHGSRCSVTTTASATRRALLGSPTFLPKEIAQGVEEGITDVVVVEGDSNAARAVVHHEDEAQNERRRRYIHAHDGAVPVNVGEPRSHVLSVRRLSVVTVCYNCLRRKPGEGSASSGVYYFCSDACRDNAKGFHDIDKNVDWSLFDYHCSSRGLKYPYMAKRLACMVISGAANADCLNILQPARLHQGTLIEMEEEFELLGSTFRKAGFQEEVTNFLTIDWYINVLARIRINAFRIELVASSYEDLLSSAAASVSCDSSVGNAVYMLPSFYNHDCDPSAHIVWLDNADAKLKALRDIEEGEELRICYIDTSLDADTRQKILADGFGFKCHCLRCLSGD